MAKRSLLFVGPVLTQSGYGVHARQLLRAIYDSNEFDISVESTRWGETPFITGPEVTWIQELVSKPVSQSPEVAVQVTIPNEFKRRAPLMFGVTAGIETDRVSAHWIEACNREVDAVIVPSEHSRAGFLIEYQGENGERLRLEKPIIVVPEGVDITAFHPGQGFSPVVDRLGVPAKNFVFCGLGLDKANGRDRKNITKLVEYFCKTFKGSQGVGLILKVSIINGSTVDFELVKKRVAEIKTQTGCGEFPKVFILHGRMSEAELAGIYNDSRVIAAVSLTHGEGYGLPLIEAAACGLPVMATDWSGHLDFLTKDGRKLFVPFEYDLAPIPQECVWEGVLEAGTNWANVRESDVSTKLQKMALSSDTPRKWASELGEHIASKYSLETVSSRFMSLIRHGVAELDKARPVPTEDVIESLRKSVKASGSSLVYTMPMSAGDVFLSTGVISALRRKHPGHRVYLATSQKYFHIVKDLLNEDGTSFIDELIEWKPWMQSPEALERVFDIAYTPNLNVQTTLANWVRGGTGRNLIDEFAAQCDVATDRPILPSTPTRDRHFSGKTVAVHSGGQKSARAWTHWTDLIRNLRASGVSVVQIGERDDISVGKVDLDLRGQTDHLVLVQLLRGVDSFIGIDSYPMHVAAVIGIPVIAIFGSSYPKSTGPQGFGSSISKFLKVIETEDRNGCERACYKDVCRVDASNPCINNIDPNTVFVNALSQLSLPYAKFVEYRPKISGYTHILNPKTHGYPYIQSIHSMMGFCDEVIVVDGGSTDGSVDELNRELERMLSESGYPDAANEFSKLKVIKREWDPEEPGMDGMQKAFGRAMVSPDAEFLWQQDADEIVHENDFKKIYDVCRRFPSDVDVVHLPVIELWGDDRHVRTDRHSWKWRLSRNNLRITHGIAQQARLIDQKTGRIYAKPGMSDGCEMIDMVTGDHLPHRGFYSKELDVIRTSNPAEYGRIMNEIFGKLPSVWHYSWADLKRKVRNFRDFWDKQWQVLYQTPPQPRFPDVVTDEDVERKALELSHQGGEHGKAPTFELQITPPSVMKDWIK